MGAELQVSSHTGRGRGVALIPPLQRAAHSAGGAFGRREAGGLTSPYRGAADGELRGGGGAARRAATGRLRPWLGRKARRSPERRRAGLTVARPPRRGGVPDRGCCNVLNFCTLCAIGHEGFAFVF